MESLKSLYVELNKIQSYRDEYCSTSGERKGKIFYFINTNYRGILLKRYDKLTGFANGFRVLSEIEGIKRNEWTERLGRAQEREKQHVINMRKSELFRVVDNAYYKTSRGIVFEKMLSDYTLKFEDKKFLTYLLILTGYFNNTPNYILERTKIVYKCFEDAGITVPEVAKLQIDFVKKVNSGERISSLLLDDYIYLDSFVFPHDEVNFLKDYWNSSEQQKKELKEYVYDNYENRSYKCIISYKFRPGGMYVKNTVAENAWLLAVSKALIDGRPANFDEFIKISMNEYAKFFTIDKKNLKKFIYNTNKNRSVFQIIFCKAFNVAIPLTEVAKDLTEDEIFELGRIDATDEAGRQRLNNIEQSLKKVAKIKSDYKCDLEEVENCKYFTAKSTNKNYVEVHHYIPREFANDFDETIEVLENYITLCPNCHRKIHLAVDNERKHMVNVLFSKRHLALKKKHLDVELNTIYEYYGIK